MENSIEPQGGLSQKEQMKQAAIAMGLLAGMFSKFILKSQGFDVNYKINGENIDDIKSLSELDISQRIKLAVSEERYEDAAVLKKLVESRSLNENNV